MNTKLFLTGNSVRKSKVPDFHFCLNSPSQHPPATLNTPVFLHVHWLPKSLLWHLQRKLRHLPIHFFICLLWCFPGLFPRTPLDLFAFCDFSPACFLELLFLLLGSYFPLQTALVISLPNYAQTTAVAEAFSPSASHHLEQSFSLLFLSASPILHLLSNLIWKRLCSHACAS